jgi:hypothetical protein
MSTHPKFLDDDQLASPRLDSGREAGPREGGAQERGAGLDNQPLSAFSLREEWAAKYEEASGEPVYLSHRHPPDWHEYRYAKSGHRSSIWYHQSDADTPGELWDGLPQPDRDPPRNHGGRDDWRESPRLTATACGFGDVDGT